ncbi:MAG: hypothetical protein GY772_23765, partial [bacterium]|nr:hypothetical protein [bacterium]
MEEDEDGFWGRSRDRQGRWLWVHRLGKTTKAVLARLFSPNILNMIAEEIVEETGQLVELKIRGRSTKRGATERPGRANRNELFVFSESLHALETTRETWKRLVDEGILCEWGVGDEVVTEHG